MTAWAKRRWSRRGRPRAAHPDLPAGGGYISKADDLEGEEEGGGAGSRGVGVGGGRRGGHGS